MLLPPVPLSGSGIFSPTFIDILRKSPEGRKDSSERGEGEHNAMSASTFEKRCLTDKEMGIALGIGSVGDAGITVVRFDVLTHTILCF